MSRCRASCIPETECFTESSDDTVLTIISVNIGDDDVIFTIFREEYIELCRYIVDIAGVLGLSYETRESFTTSEADRALCRYSSGEEGEVHEKKFTKFSKFTKFTQLGKLKIFNPPLYITNYTLFISRRHHQRCIHEFIDEILFDKVASFFPEFSIGKFIKILF